MTIGKDELLRYFEDNNIPVTHIEHPPAFTVNDKTDEVAALPGAHTKNLFLKDKKGNYFLVTAEDTTQIDLKSLHRKIGASGRLSFGSAEKLDTYLGLYPGAVTIFGIINDRDNHIQVILDQHLMDYDLINGHPMTNDMTTTIKREDLMRFLETNNHPPMIISLEADIENA